jgi:hypothetical protein
VLGEVGVWLILVVFWFLMMFVVVWTLSRLIGLFLSFLMSGVLLVKLDVVCIGLCSMLGRAEVCSVKVRHKHKRVGVCDGEHIFTDSDWRSLSLFGDGCVACDNLCYCEVHKFSCLLGLPLVMVPCDCFVARCWGEARREPSRTTV